MLCILLTSYSFAYDYPEGALKGLFSVSETDTICFSKGNLRYNVNEKTWQFASSQTAAIFNESTYPKDRSSKKYYISSFSSFDLFGWATSGWDNTAADPGAINYNPMSVWDRKKTEKIIHSIDCSTLSILGYCDTTFAYKYNRYGFGPSSDMPDINLVGSSENYDFGLYNEIIGGGNQKGIWRLPTKEEMQYLLQQRPNAKYLRGPAVVNNKAGFILLPDNFIIPDGITWHYQEQCTTNDLMNTYTSSQWSILENAGAVFIPSMYLPHPRTENGGYNPCIWLGGSQSFGAKYWTSTSTGSTNSDRAYIWSPTGISTDDREYPYAVRLVCTIAQKQGEGLEDVNVLEQNRPKKILNNGQIYILRGDKIYTIQGQELK